MIEKAHVEHWADMQSTKGDFPQLIRRLVYASVTPYLLKGNIPYGSAVFMGGWDGEVETSQQTEYMPLGKSILELGTDGTYKRKAEDDYAKRSAETYEGLNKAETTFIFMTPRVWGNKKDWEDEKKKEGIWKDVRVYDSTVLAQWIISVPSVELWFAPFVDITSPNLVIGEERLEELLTGGDVKLRPSFYTAGREEVAMKMKDMLGSPTLRAFRASSKEEAIGFILAAGKLFSQKEQEEFYSKTIVVEDKTAFRQMKVQTSMINLVPDFEDATVLYRAVAQGKIVLVPLGPGDDFNQYVEDLPSPDRFALEKSLIESGVEEERAKRIIKDCSCNLTMIKKELGFPILRVDWLNDDDVNEIMPALIVERWNDSFDGDREIMSSLSGADYEAFQSSMVQWSQKPVPPVMNIGAFWRITSPLSLWSVLSCLISKKHIDELAGLSVQVLSDESGKYSNQLKQGLLNSLIILAWHGAQLFPRIGFLQRKVDDIINQVIGCASAKRWNSIAQYLPLVAEASPSVFLMEVKRSLSENDSQIMSLFNEEEGMFAPESNYPYLLWALESLAWLPESLKDVTEVLLILSEKDPGGKLDNRPFNSLINIYLPWYPNTTSSIDQRLSIIDALSKGGYSKMWNYLMSLLPKSQSFTSGTHQLKWRGYDLLVNKGVPYSEIWKTTEFACEKLKETFDGDDLKLAKFVNELVPVPHAIRRKVITWIKEQAEANTNQFPETRKAIRELLWFQKKLKPNNEHRLSNAEITDLEMAYEALVPTDIVEKNKWLFDDFSPRILEVCDDNDPIKSIKAVTDIRRKAVKEWLDQLPLEEVVNVRKLVAEPSEYGRLLGCSDSVEVLSNLVLPLLSNEEDQKFVNGYIQGLEGKIGEDKLLELFEKFSDKMPEEDAVLFLHYMWSTDTLFKYLDTRPESIQKGYWIKFNAHLFGPYNETKLYSLEKLKSVGRSLDAINGTWHYAKELPTNVIQDMLMESMKCPLEINGRIDLLAFESYMEELHHRTDADEAKLFQLEWMFLPLLRNQASKSIFRLLFERLQKDPQLFVELLTFLYRPEHEDENEVIENDTDESVAMRKNNAFRAFYLMREWNTIPGVDKDGRIDKETLREWVCQAIKLAKEKDREKFVYSCLGELFAKYPERKDNPHWPPIGLFELMEELNSDKLFQNYNIGLFNKRGFTTRGGYDGGDIERYNAEYFEGLKNQCLPLYPHVAKVFEDLANQYEQMAKEMDDQAAIAKLDY